jgi:hypothetical protein
MEGGKTLSTFPITKNSEGNKQRTYSLPRFMAMGYTDQLFTKFKTINWNYTGYGAIGSDDSVGNFMEWDVNYVEINM